LIINVGPVFGVQSLSYFSAYASTKMALKAFSYELKRELKDTGISIAHIVPKFIDYASNEINRLYERLDITADSNEDIVISIRDCVLEHVNQHNGKFTHNVMAILKNGFNAIVERLQAKITMWLHKSLKGKVLDNILG